MQTEVASEHVTLPQITEPEADPLAIYRQQVREEAATQKPKMSDAQAARLRAISAEDKFEKIAEGRFATALTQIVPTLENLQKLISRCTVSDFYTLDADGNVVPRLQLPQHLDRRAYKLAYWIERGYRLGERINTPQDILFMSNLTPEEVKMSDAQFAEEWRVKRGQKPVAPLNAAKEPKECALRSRCLRAVKRHGASVPGKGFYCSEACRGRAKVLARKDALEEPKTAPTVPQPNVATVC